MNTCNSRTTRLWGIFLFLRVIVDVPSRSTSCWDECFKSGLRCGLAPKVFECGVPGLQLEARVRHVLEVWPHLTSALQMHPEDRRSGIGDASLCAAAACSVEPRRLRL